ncbi:MAG: HAMP domain-containing sensor histidine kinase [Chryseolinea sp.]
MEGESHQQSSEETIALLKKQIDELTREKQQIISLVSHDIKAPLNRVFALVQLIQMEGENLTEDQLDYLTKMHLVVADGLGMIRNLVDYRNLEYRRIEIIPEEIDIVQVMKLVIRNFSTLADMKKIELEVQSPDSLMIQSDNHCILRSFENLISNGLKFSNEGKKVFIKMQRNDHGATISVQDEAGGFTQDDLKKMYGKFQKLSALPTAGESTTGLGLLIIKLMLKKVKGEIQCETTEGVGSVFTITLPRSIS